MPISPLRRITPRGFIIILLILGAFVVMGIDQLHAAPAAPSRICTVESESARGFSAKRVEQRAEEKLNEALALVRAGELGAVPDAAFISTVCETDKALVRCTSSVTICNEARR
ncbi:hypothetical protein [Methyloligella solikamskensis]|uniref:Uncharacterized protein n=1 Tax=Methyloligella solikamskensis TaxID=1177756 RepID=A0ABW3JAC4_9HYPH